VRLTRRSLLTALAGLYLVANLALLVAGVRATREHPELVEQMRRCVHVENGETVWNVDELVRLHLMLEESKR